MIKREYIFGRIVLGGEGHMLSVAELRDQEARIDQQNPDKHPASTEHYSGLLNACLLFD
jgi:hypothetical protein